MDRGASGIRNTCPLVAARLHTSLIHHDILVAVGKSNTRQFTTHVDLAGIEFDAARLPPTLLEPRRRLGNDLAIFENRQLTGVFIKRYSVRATLNKCPVDLDIGPKRNRLVLTLGERSRAGQSNKQESDNNAIYELHFITPSKVSVWLPLERFPGPNPTREHFRSVTCPTFICRARPSKLTGPILTILRLPPSPLELESIGVHAVDAMNEVMSSVK